jgi:hypothetical protein
MSARAQINDEADLHDKHHGEINNVL